MILLSARSIKKSFGADPVLDGIDLDLKKGRRLALLGANGSGKTTLLRILAGELELDEGRVTTARDCRLGYQSQHFSFTPGNTVLDEGLSVFVHLAELEREIRRLEREIAAASPEKQSRLLEQYSALNQRFEDLDGYSYPARTRSVLSGLGFSDEDFSRPVEALSGGQQSRLALARLLLVSPDILLLDEPTNHLDIEGIQWLEDYLQSYKGALLFVSHDRRFLSLLADSICELTGKRLEHYAGGYGFYREERKRRREKQYKEYIAQQQYIKKSEEFIARNIAGQNTRQAQSRRRELEKLERIAPPPGEHIKAAFKFGQRRPSGRHVLECRNLTMEFNGLPLFKNISFSIERGERVALIGPNGCGKTTLLEIICGLRQPTAGRVKYGYHVEIAYFSQKRVDLDPEKSAAEEIWSVRPFWTRGQVQNLLARFLFRGEEAFRQVKHMSGGEATRLALAKLLLAEANFLVLDEPANHLDIDDKEVLEDALNEYPGTLLTVSHDRWFLNRVTSVTMELSATGIERFPGNYDYWLAKKKTEETGRNADRKKVQQLKNGRKVNRGLSPNEIYRRQQKLAQLEEEIAKNEDLKRQLEEEVNEASADHERLTELAFRLQELNQQLEELCRSWAAVGEELEQSK